MRTYKRVNKIQEVMSLLFPNKKYRDLISRKEMSFYNPKLNKFKLALCGAGIVGSIITPCTPEFIIIPFLVRWLLI